MPLWDNFKDYFDYFIFSLNDLIRIYLSTNHLQNLCLIHHLIILELVGIHCTHGVNRTGYLVSRFLIEWLGYEPEKAIEGLF